jgi:hypothetical protein
MDQPKPPPREQDYVASARERRIANLVLLTFFVVLVGAGYWLVNAMFEQRVVDDCLAQGRRNCAPVEAPTR